MSDIAGTVSAVTNSAGQLYAVEDVTKSAVSVDGQLANVNMVHISQEDYEELVATSSVVSSNLYVLSSDHFDAYGQQVKNVAPGTDLSDAATVEQVNAVSSQLGNYSLTSHTHSNYVQTSRTVAGYQLTANVTAANISSAIGLGSYALDISALHKTGNETVAGEKTFSDAFTVGTRKSGSDVGQSSISEGNDNVASDFGSHAEGQSTSCLAPISHAEGYHSEASLASGNSGCGVGVHAEGWNSRATSGAAHAEGEQTTASNYAAHSEGGYTEASGPYSHAEGEGTVASNEAEHAQGQYNISNKSTSTFGSPGNTVDSIGIGAYNARKNATEVMQNGDAYFLGVGGYDGTNAASATSKPLASVIGAKADLSSLSYKLTTAAGTLSSGSYVYDVEDRSVTTIGINQSSTPVIVRLPDAGNGARDFILRIEISSSSAPSFTFTNSAGLDFDSEDDDWAVMEPGLNIVSFTETKR